VTRNVMTHDGNGRCRMCTARTLAGLVRVYPGPDPSTLMLATHGADKRGSPHPFGLPEVSCRFGSRRSAGSGGNVTKFELMPAEEPFDPFSRHAFKALCQRLVALPDALYRSPETALAPSRHTRETGRHSSARGPVEMTLGTDKRAREWGGGTPKTSV